MTSFWNMSQIFNEGLKGRKNFAFTDFKLSCWLCHGNNLLSLPQTVSCSQSSVQKTVSSEVFFNVDLTWGRPFSIMWLKNVRVWSPETCIKTPLPQYQKFLSIKQLLLMVNCTCKYLPLLSPACIFVNGRCSGYTSFLVFLPSD